MDLKTSKSSSKKIEVDTIEKIKKLKKRMMK